MDFISSFSLINPADQAQILVSGFSFFISVAVLYFIHRMNEYDRLTRSLSVLAIFSVFWAFFGLLSYLSTLGHLRHIFHILSIAFIPFFIAQFFEFAFAVFEEAREIPSPFSFFLWRCLFFGVAAVLSMFFLFDALGITNSMVASVAPRESGSYFLSLGLFTPFFISFFSVSALVALESFRYSFRARLVRRRFQAKWFFGSFFLAFALGGAYYLLVSPVPVFFAFIPSSALFILGAGYAIRRGSAISTKITRVRSINVIIWFLIFLRLLFEKDPIDLVLGLGVLFLTVILGMLLIKSTEKEGVQKEELATQSTALKDLNASLEWEVTERTRDLAMQKAHTDLVINSLSVGLVEYTEEFKVVRMNRKAEELLGVGWKEGKGLQFQPSNAETFDLRYQSLKDVLFSDLAATLQESIKEKKVPVRKDGNESFERRQQVVIVNPIMRTLDVITFPVENSHRKDDSKLYIKLLRDVTGEEFKASPGHREPESDDESTDRRKL